MINGFYIYVILQVKLLNNNLLDMSLRHCILTEYHIVSRVLLRAFIFIFI